MNRRVLLPAGALALALAALARRFACGWDWPALAAGSALCACCLLAALAAGRRYERALDRLAGAARRTPGQADAPLTEAFLCARLGLDPGTSREVLGRMGAGVETAAKEECS